MNNTPPANTSLENATDSSMTVPSKAEGIAWCSAFILTSIIMVVGNFLTIILFAVYHNLHKKSLLLVMNMALVDLMLGTVSVPSYIYFNLGPAYQLWTESVNIPMENVFVIFDNVLMLATINSVASISVERFYAIYWPFKHRTLSMRAYRIAIFMVWAIAALGTAINIVFNLLISYKRGFYVWIASTLTPTFIICACNVSILRKFQQGRFASQQQIRATQNKRLTKTLLLVAVLALLTWLPLIILNCLRALDVEIPWRYFLIASILNYSSSFVNPAAYALRIPEFRQALALCCFRRQTAINMKHIER